MLLPQPPLGYDDSCAGQQSLPPALPPPKPHPLHHPQHAHSPAALATANPGLQKLIVGAFGLPTGLMLVLICGAELFTGNTAFVTAAATEGRATMRQLAKSWAASYAGNVLGSLAFVWAIAESGLLTGAAAPKVSAAPHAPRGWGWRFAVRAALLVRSDLRRPSSFPTASPFLAPPSQNPGHRGCQDLPALHDRAPARLPVQHLCVLGELLRSVSPPRLKAPTSQLLGARIFHTHLSTNPTNPQQTCHT